MDCSNSKGNGAMDSRVNRPSQRRERAWDKKRLGTGASSARVISVASAAAALVSCACLTWMPMACSAFVVSPSPSAATGRCCGCRYEKVTVNIERTSMNSRRISGSIVINRPIEDVWLTLTDYNRLAEYVPNLVQSKVVPSNDGTIRLWQEGAQKIVGFDFRASVEMFMDEHFGDPENKMAQRRLTFGLLDSRMFNEFDGEWRMQFNSRKQRMGPRGPEYEYSTKLFYMVHIRPKGPVPVLALEWQISNEVPNNLTALKQAAELVTPDYAEKRRREREQEFAQRNLSGGYGDSASYASVNGSNDGNNDAGAKVGAEAFIARGDGRGQPEWETDETLEAYIAKG